MSAHETTVQHRRLLEGEKFSAKVGKTTVMVSNTNNVFVAANSYADMREALALTGVKAGHMRLDFKGPAGRMFYTGWAK